MLQYIYSPFNVLLHEVHYRGSPSIIKFSGAHLYSQVERGRQVFSQMGVQASWKHPIIKSFYFSHVLYKWTPQEKTCYLSIKISCHSFVCHYNPLNVQAKLLENPCNLHTL